MKLFCLTLLVASGAFAASADYYPTKAWRESTPEEQGLDSKVLAGMVDGIMQKHLNVRCAPVWCTRTASRLVRTNSDKHGLKDLCKELLGVEISKQQQSSDWGAAKLSPEQVDYASADVLYLHQLKAELEKLLAREGRADLAAACFQFLPDRAALDVAGWGDEDIFAH